MKNHQSIAVVNFSALSRCEQPVPVIGNYRMDVHKECGEEPIFPLKLPKIDCVTVKTTVKFQRDKERMCHRMARPLFAFAGSNL